MQTEEKTHEEKESYKYRGCCKTCFCALGIVLGIFLAVWAVAKGVEIKRMLEYPPAGIPEHTISVSATSKAQVTPNTAELELSVLTEGSTPQAVQQESTKKMNAIIDFVKSQKVDAKDVQTATYSLYPKYEYIKGQSNIVGYTLTQTLRVKARDLNIVGVLLEGATLRGANQIGDVRFTIDDPEKFKESARDEAIIKAKTKAAEIARAAGVKLGKVIGFSESAGDFPPPIFYGKAEALGVGGAGGPPQTEPGTQEVSVTVSLSYMIE